ncbi:electron transfer flavoprotein subunit alpha/FixB family protein [Candidatus Pantoea multigeneris]|uniref:Electron transfer flavoprotein subunit alpha/FixB family protein n=1 Tax=Candidatus Pantoea multigeneris TaxID=2608357 RepID=A0ABX0R862_9GAMM|nr:FAD-binding protein [Pantoea multigeneris]NIF21531.1 electron transfer flavoprotein subunit alpha/FixB family protein [Pantoea multigeneris]
MKTLIIAEHDNLHLNPITLNTVQAAAQIGNEIHVLVAGYGCQAVAQAAAKIHGVTQVFVADNEAYAHQLAENVAPLIVEVAQSYSHILAPATTQGKNVLPRVAALYDVAQISDIIAVVSADTFKRPIYAGNAIATVKSEDCLKVITVRGSSFAPVESGSGNASIEPLSQVFKSDKVSFVREQLEKTARPELNAARIVVSGGRGVGSRENFALLEQLADKLGAAVGASRAAVDSGYAQNDLQVGQTGKIVAPDLYIAVGISGAIQHLAGMKESKIIVAINKDDESPIFQVADYGLVGDLFDVLPELTSKI